MNNKPDVEEESSGLSSLATASLLAHLPREQKIASIPSPPPPRRLRRHHRPWEDEEDQDVNPPSSSSAAATTAAVIAHREPDQREKLLRHHPMTDRTGCRAERETDPGGSFILDRARHEQGLSSKRPTSSWGAKAKRAKIEEPLPDDSCDRVARRDVPPDAEGESQSQRPLGRRPPLFPPLPPVPSSSRLPPLPSLVLPSDSRAWAHLHQSPAFSSTLSPASDNVTTSFAPTTTASLAPSVAPSHPSEHDAMMLHYYLSLVAYYSPLYLATLPQQLHQYHHHDLRPTGMLPATSAAPSSADLMPPPLQRQALPRPPPFAPSSSTSPSSTPQATRDPSPAIRAEHRAHSAGYVFRDETDKLATASRKRQHSRTSAQESDHRSLYPQPLLPKREEGERTKSERDADQESRPAGDEQPRGTWRDKQGSFTFHSLEALEASKKKGGRVRLKWKKES